MVVSRGGGPDTALSGPAAAVLGELCRSRWETATDERLGPVRAAGRCWPDGLDAVLERVAVGIARTIPEMPEQSEFRKVERLFPDQIERAKRTV